MKRPYITVRPLIYGNDYLKSLKYTLNNAMLVCM